MMGFIFFSVFFYLVRKFDNTKDKKAIIRDFWIIFAIYLVWNALSAFYNIKVKEWENMLIYALLFGLILIKATFISKKKKKNRS